jgi:hypothetical protein
MPYVHTPRNRRDKSRRMYKAKAYRLAKQYGPVVTERRDIHSLCGLPVMSGVRPKPCMASLVSENAGNS